MVMLSILGWRRLDVAEHSARLDESIHLATSPSDKNMFLVPRFNDDSSRSVGITVVVGVRDRQEHLMRVLPGWLKFSEINEIIIVDWSSLEPIVNTLSTAAQSSPSISAVVKDPRVRVIRAEGQKHWVLSLACNLGLRLARYDKILKVDAETEMLDMFFSKHELREGTFFAGNWRLAHNENEEHLNGLLYAYAADLASIGGYDERIQSYGWDDSDLHQRLEKVRGLQRMDLSPEYVAHTVHEDVMRTAHVQPVPGGIADVETQRNRKRSEILNVWRADDDSALYEAVVEHDSTSGMRFVRTWMQFRPRGQQQLLSEQINEAVDVEIFKAYLVKSIGPKVWDMRLPSKVLERMLVSYPQGKKLFVVHVSHGLGNRLQGVAQAAYVAANTGRHLRVVWVPDEHCNARFNDLFDNDEIEAWDEYHAEEYTRNTNFKIMDMMADGYNPWVNEELQMNASIDQHIYVRLSAQWFVPEVPFEEQAKFLQTLRPARDVAKAIIAARQVQEEGQAEAAVRVAKDVEGVSKIVSKMIGVHVRHLDPSQEIEGLTAANYTSEWARLSVLYRNQSSPHAFARLMRIALDAHPSLRFFVSADKTASLHALQKHFPGRIYAIPSVCKDRSRQCVVEAAADMLLLSLTRAIIGSYESTFSQIAARFRMVPCFSKNGLDPALFRTKFVPILDPEHPAEPLEHSFSPGVCL